MTQARRHSIQHIATGTLLFLLASHAALAADQTQPGAGNAAALRLAHQSPLVQSAMHFLVEQAKRIHDRALRTATLDILTNAKTCVLHLELELELPAVADGFRLGSQAGWGCSVRALFTAGAALATQVPAVVKAG